ncbi:MAG: hypothetical protein Q9169_003825 [Polycauliona sp. 2 TL-2023]
MDSNHLPTTLVDLLENHLILSLVAPSLPPKGILSLAQTSRSFRTLVFVTHPNYVFRYLNLSTLSIFQDFDAPSRALKSVNSHADQPARKAFRLLDSKAVFDCVTTLILDRMTVPAPLLWRILSDQSFNIRILSVREVEKLNDALLKEMIRRLIQPWRPKGSLKLRALYYFTPSDPVHEPSQMSDSTAFQGVTNSLGSQLGQAQTSVCVSPSVPSWTSGKGLLFESSLVKAQDVWVQLIEESRGLIAFDTIICHHSPASGLNPCLANVALAAHGCQGCRSAPEQPMIYGQTPAQDLPLLSPPPLFASTVKAAQCPRPGENPRFYARCTQCLQGRWCSNCNVWWCEDCYTPRANSGRGVPASDGVVKVYMGLCVQKCLIQELYTGAGEGGMWG